MKAMKKLVSVITLVVLLFTVTACGERESTSFWKGENLLPIFVILDEVEDKGGYTELFKGKNITTIGEADADIYSAIEKYNQNIQDYFSIKGIDVVEDIECLNKVYLYKQEQYDTSTLYGFADVDEGNIYLNEEVLLNTDLLKSVYTHEVVHCLGFNEDELQIFNEGVIDVIAEDIVGETYVDASGYYVAKACVKAMALSDPDMIDYIGSMYVRINQQLSGVERLYNKQDDVSHFLEMLLEIMYYDYATDEEKKTALIQIEYVIAAYCKTFELDDETINKIKDEMFVDLENYGFGIDGVVYIGGEKI